MRPPRTIICPNCNLPLVVKTTERRRNRGRGYYYRNRIAILVRNKLGVSIGEARKLIERGEVEEFVVSVKRRRSK